MSGRYRRLFLALLVLSTAILAVETCVIVESINAIQQVQRLNEDTSTPNELAESSDQEFVLDVCDKLFRWYYDPSQLSYPKLLNAALEGVSKKLARHGVDFQPNVIDETADEQEAKRIFSEQLDKAIELAQAAENMHPDAVAFSASAALLASTNDSHTVFLYPDGYDLADDEWFYVETFDYKGKKFVYIWFESFREELAEEFNTKVKPVLSGADGILVDLRFNPGGYMSSLNAVLDFFLPKGTPAYIYKNRYWDRVYITGGQQQTKLPLVVLTNQYSYSASEVFASAMKEAKRATLVGVKTGGMVGGALEFDLARRAKMLITVHEVLTAEGKKLEGHGVKPDVEAENLPLNKAVETLYDLANR